MYNRILDGSAIQDYKKEQDFLEKITPEMSARKYPQAHVQQAFVFKTVLDFVGSQKSQFSILCVGCWEDTTCDVLLKMGYSIIGIDPMINYDLNLYHARKYGISYFDVVFSTSVIEHVEDDETFVRQLSDLVKPEGIGIITCDYNSSWSLGAPKPPEDFRLYTREDLEIRLTDVLEKNNCCLVDEPKWQEASYDFTYAGVNYTFASLVFKKLGELK